MINSDAALEKNLQLIQSMYQAIVALKRDIAPQNFTNYLILAEGPIEQIRRLRAEIDEYLGIQEAVAAAEREALDLVAQDAPTAEPAHSISP